MLDGMCELGPPVALEGGQQVKLTEVEQAMAHGKEWDRAIRIVASALGPTANVTWLARRTTASTRAELSRDFSSLLR